MKITALVVCVNYSDLLEKSIDLWRAGCDRLVVVTTAADTATRKMCAEHWVETFETDVFYANGAKFNKGAALSQAAVAVLDSDTDWICTFDADTVPPQDWRQQIEGYGLTPGKLYGARRWRVDVGAKNELGRWSSRQTPSPMPQSWVIGFFMMFHKSDPNVGTPLFDMFWPHCGNYDTTFARRWPTSQQVLLPLRFLHIGDERRNWMGRGNDVDMQALLRRRREGYHESWLNERMPNPPELIAHA